MRSGTKQTYIVVAVGVAALASSAGLLYRYVADHLKRGSAASARLMPPVAAGASSAPREAPNAASPNIDAAADRMAKRLREQGGTGEEWAFLARSFVQLKRYPDAVDAYAHALEKMPGNEILEAERAAAGTAAGAVPAR
jgi:cytochrome c-type biogenesis protein CcmH/NrfG